MAFVIGVDSSTTASKAVVWDESGRPLAERRSSLELNREIYPSTRPLFTQLQQALE